MSEFHKKRISILLVEDDSVDAEEIQRALNKTELQIVVEWVTTVKAGLDLSKNATFDIILTDLRLPDLHDKETIISLRSQYPGVPIIALTGNEDDIGLDMLRVGATDFLPKKRIDKILISRAINYSLERHRMRLELENANKKLKEKNKHLAHLCDTSERFVDNVSHEFRSPLTVIREYASIIRDGLDGPVTRSQKNRITTLINRTDEMSRMVDDILDTSKLSSGLVRIRRGSCSIRETIDQAVSTLAQSAKSKRVKLIVSDIVDETSVFCDDQKCRRILINLINNAIKFTPPGGEVRVEVSFDEQEAQIKVIDSGVGIPQSFIGKIFDRFQQLSDETRTNNSKGFGLGLSIARELAFLNLGQLTLSSKEGEGSTFSFSVPLNRPLSVARSYLNLRTQNDRDAGDTALISITHDVHDRAETHEVVQEFLSRCFKRNDVVINVTENCWVLLAAATPDEARCLSSRVQKQWDKRCKNHAIARLPELKLSTLEQANLLGGRAKLERKLEKFVEDSQVNPCIDNCREDKTSFVSQPRTAISDHSTCSQHFFNEVPHSLT